MLKNNIRTLVSTSIVILLPALIGLIFWNNPTLFIPALIILGLQWICILFTLKDPKNNDMNRKVFRMVTWICPVISVFSSTIIYISSTGETDNLMIYLCLFLGLAFAIIGNYLPKCTQNFTVGIKVKWALANEENWNATHRFGGRIWVLGGILLMLCGFLPEALFPWMMLIAIFVLAVIPTLYSYLYYKKQVANGTAPEKVLIPMDKRTKRVSIAGCVIGVLILIGALIMVFTGEIEVTYKDDSFTVNATYWNDVTIEYASIDQVDYREDFDAGSRIYGYGGARLLLGTFQNKEFGDYTLYSYNPCDTCIVLDIDGKIVVIGSENAANTKEIYEELLLHVQ